MAMIHSADSFLASLGQYLAEGGMPPAAGRMLGWLLLRDRPSSLDEVAEALQVSKSAASDHGRLLAHLGVVEVRRRPSDRRDYYEASPQLCERLLEQCVRRMEALGGCLAEGVRVTGVPGNARKRIAQAVDANARITSRLRELAAWLRDHPLQGKA
jgi:DNA-binding MarR family transcriptional regulator